MALKRRKSTAVEKARKRLAGIESITPRPEFGRELSADAYRKAVEATEMLLDAYNHKLAEADAAGNDLKAQEAGLREYSRRMLSAVEGIYGPDSNEYEQAGGTRVSERKKPVRSTDKNES